MSLRDRLAERIALSGPISVADYMQACLHDPEDGYYATRPAIGVQGDFITAPSVSQMFGELIGLWCAEVWTRRGSPEAFILAEVGPGEGLLFSDLLRATRIAPEFLAAAQPWLVEPSPVLRAVQQERLAGSGAQWASSLDALPTGLPLILIANEVLDCLPTRQFIRTGRGWAERRVGLQHGGLAFGLAACPLPLGEAPEGAVLEVSSAQEGFARALAARLAVQGGAALLIDYGSAERGFGDTLQAVRRHQKESPLASPGEADLTVHAQFSAVTAAALAEGCSARLTSQGRFLLSLGLEARAAGLARARPDQAAALARQTDRLAAPDQMGELFKVCCLGYPPDMELPGFDD